MSASCCVSTRYENAMDEKTNSVCVSAWVDLFFTKKEGFEDVGC